MDVLIVLSATLLAALFAMFLWLEQNRQHIQKNWVQYRCQPYIMPFASLFGKDTTTNFQYCMTHSFKGYANYLFEPVYYMMSVIGSIVGDITKSIDDVRSMLSSVRGGFLGIVGSVLGKVENVVSEVVVLFVRMRDIMSRLVGTMVILANVGLTASSTGGSLMNGPIGQVIDYFCFAGDTPVCMADGTTKWIRDVQLGDVLRHGQRVTSLLRFDGGRCPMYRLGDVIVSGNHLVLLDGRWIMVRDHPAATDTAQLAVVYCLNTSDHTICTKDYIFRDFEETDDPAVIAGVQELIAAEKDCYQSFMVTGSYDTGFRHGTGIACHGGSLRPIEEIEIGDRLADGGVVTGVLRHATDSDSWVKHNGVACLRDTALGQRGTWLRACKSRNAVKIKMPKSSPAYMLCTSTGVIPLANGWMALDDQESYDARTNNARDRLVCDAINKK